MMTLWTPDTFLYHYSKEWGRWLLWYGHYVLYLQTLWMQRNILWAASLYCWAIYAHAGTEFGGFNHRDVATRYRASFMHLAYREGTLSHIQAAFDHLARNEPKGPQLGITIKYDMPMAPWEDQELRQELRWFNLNWWHVFPDVQSWYRCGFW